MSHKSFSPLPFAGLRGLVWYILGKGLAIFFALFYLNLSGALEQGNLPAQVLLGLICLVMTFFFESVMCGLSFRQQDYFRNRRRAGRDILWGIFFPISAPITFCRWTVWFVYWSKKVRIPFP